MKQGINTEEKEEKTLILTGLMVQVLKEDKRSYRQWYQQSKQETPLFIY